MRAPLFLISLALSSAACSDKVEYAEKTGVEAAAKGDSATSVTAKKGSAKPFFFEEELTEGGGGAMQFAFAWPAAVTAETALAAELDKHREEMFDATRAEWKSSAKDCPDDAVSCRNYSYANEYKVVADLPRFLSLSSDLSTYTGGAHGLYGRDALVWDRETQKSLDPVAMFISLADLGGAIQSKACAALDSARAKRRGAPVEGANGEWPNNCPDMDETTLFLGSSNGKTFDRLGLYYGPYVAGSYAEGAYEIDLPVTGSVIDAVKPEYRKAFSIKR